jgi:hypothetical protein
MIREMRHDQLFFYSLVYASFLLLAIAMPVLFVIVFSFQSMSLLTSIYLIVQWRLKC